MRLHQINQLTYPEPLETTWQNSVQTGDSILLIEESILRALHQINALSALITEKQITLYYLQSDATAYGLSPSIGTALSDEEWVDITFSAEANISW
jgi:tRNA 2-thiouridine synthesizing protein B